MFKKQKPYKTILKRITSKRPIVKPNPGFVLQLKEFEQKLIEWDYELENTGIYLEERKLEELKYSEPDATPDPPAALEVPIKPYKAKSSSTGSSSLDFLDKIHQEEHKESHFKFDKIDGILK